MDHSDPTAHVGADDAQTGDDPSAGPERDLQRLSAEFAALGGAEEGPSPHGRRPSMVLAAVVLAVVLAVVGVLVVASGRSEAPSSTVPGDAAVTGPSEQPATPPTAPTPDPIEVQAAVDYEATQIATGSAAGFSADYDYTLTFFRDPSSPTTVEVSGTATLVRSAQLGRLTLRPSGGDEVVLWLDSATATIRWCDTVCHDISRTPPPDMAPASPWMQAVTLAVNLDPGWMATAPPRPTQSTTMILTDIGGATCTRLAGVLDGEVVTSERCWDGNGQVEALTTTGQSVRRTSSVPYDATLQLPAPAA